MRNVKRFISLACVALFVLCGCDFDVTAKVSCSDVKTVLANSAQPRFLAATVTMESAGEDGRAKQMAFIQSFFRDVKTCRIVTNDITECIVADFSLPLIHESRLDTHGADDFLALVLRPEGEGAFSMGAYVNEEKYDYLVGYMENEYWQTISMKNIKITLAFKNDTDAAIPATFGSVYIDDKALPFKDTVSVESGETVSIRLSDVLKDTLGKGATAFFGTVSLRKVLHGMSRHQDEITSDEAKRLLEEFFVAYQAYITETSRVIEVAAEDKSEENMEALQEKLGEAQAWGTKFEEVAGKVEEAGISKADARAFMNRYFDISEQLGAPLTAFNKEAGEGYMETLKEGRKQVMDMFDN